MISAQVLVLISLALMVPSIGTLRAVYVGGGLDDDNAEVWDAFIKLATPRNSTPFIGIITAASDYDEATDNGDYYVNLLKSNYSVKNVVWIPIDVNHPGNAGNTTIVAEVLLMTGIFFGGGDQERLKSCLMTNNTDGTHSDTPVLAAIRAKANNGLVALGGTSAGTDIQQATPMITGGLSWDALAYGPFNYFNTSNEDSDLLTYDESGGFGFFNFSFIDTHVGTRGRQGRIIRMISAFIANRTWGIGIDENTAIVVNNDTIDIVGYNGVYVIDLTHASNISNNSKYFNIQNVSVHYLTKEDKFNLVTRETTFAYWKSNIAGQQQHILPKVGKDIFSAWNSKTDEIMNPEEFANITTYLFNSNGSNVTYGKTYETGPCFIVNFDQSHGIGFVGTKDDLQYISYADLRLNISALATFESINN